LILVWSADGTEGIVDLSHLVNKPVLKRAAFLIFFVGFILIKKPMPLPGAHH
jgi:hypothetical protein